MQTDLITDESEIRLAAHSLKAMAHPLRLKILCTLSTGRISVQDLVEQVGTTQSNVSQHLAILRDKGILDFYRDANKVYYFVEDERMLQLVRMIKEVFCKHQDAMTAGRFSPERHQRIPIFKKVRKK
jgi:ArsR family transcriptional regulator